MFERQTRDRHAGESLGQTLARWRLILFVPMVVLGMVLAVAWPSIQHAFRARSGSCTRLFSPEELAAIAFQKSAPAPEVDQYALACDADYPGVARISVHLDDGGEFEDAVWKLSYEKKAGFARLPGPARAFLAVDGDGRGRVVRALDGAYVDVSLAPAAGIEGARKVAAMLDDGRLARFDTGFAKPASAARTPPGTCGTLLTEADVSSLLGPGRRVDLMHQWTSGDHTMCTIDVLVDAQPLVSLDVSTHLEGSTFEKATSVEDGETVEPVGREIAIVRGPAGSQIVVGVPGGVGRLAVHDPSVGHNALAALAGRMAERRSSLAEAP